MVKKEEDILLLDEKESSKKSYIPIIVITSLVTVILFICMYNWYYMFNTSGVTEAYNNVVSTEIGGYSFMKNIFGMTEEFGYWTGFSMSALLLLASLVMAFIYSIKFDKFVDGVKDGIIKMMPTIACTILSLFVIVLSLNNSDSFIYSIINNIFNALVNKQVLGVLSITFLHNIFINDYFAILSSIAEPLTNFYGTDSIDLSLFAMQIGHGLASLVTPFSIYLIAGLSFLRVSYVEWLKYIFKTLIIILGISLVVIFITATI